MTSPILLVSHAAVVSDNDGSAFITKAEFDSLKNNFQAQIDNYNQSIDSKIDGAIAAYLAGIKVNSGDQHLSVDWVLEWEDKTCASTLSGKRITIVTYNARATMKKGMFTYQGGWVMPSSGASSWSQKKYTPQTLYGVDRDWVTSELSWSSGSGYIPFTGERRWSRGINLEVIPIITFIGSDVPILVWAYLKPQYVNCVVASYHYVSSDTTQYSSISGFGATNYVTEGVDFGNKAAKQMNIYHRAWDGVLGQEKWPMQIAQAGSGTGNPIDSVGLIWFPILYADDGAGDIDFKYYLDRDTEWENFGAVYTAGIGNYSIHNSESKVYFFIRKPDGEMEQVSESPNITREDYENNKWKKVSVSMRAGYTAGLVVQINQNDATRTPNYATVCMNYTNLNP